MTTSTLKKNSWLPHVQQEIFLKIEPAATCFSANSKRKEAQ